MLGTGTEAGNENGHIVGFRECTWGSDDAPRLPRAHPMRVRAVYNATTHVSGAMARFLLAGRPVGAEERSESLSPASESLDRKRVLDKRVEPDIERDMELDRNRLLPPPCLLPCPCLARRRLCR